MGIYDYRLPPDAVNSSRRKLEQYGPIISIQISPSDQISQLLSLSGGEVPAPVQGWGIVDTGASTTAIYRDVLSQIGSNPIGTVNVNTAGTPSVLDIYPAKINFPGTDIVRDFEEVIGMEREFGSYANLPIIGLIGREVLSDCVFIYNGITGIYTLTH